MDPAMVRELPKWRALLIRGGLSPVIVKCPLAWRAPEYRAARRRGQTVAALVPAAAYRSITDAIPAGALPAEPVLEPAGAPGDGDYPWSTG
jgi:hypothetical protein